MMTTLIWLVGFCFCLALIFALANSRSDRLFNSYKAGALIWGQVLPLAALGVYYYCLVANLLPTTIPYEQIFSLSTLFSHSELLFFFVAGLAMLTRFANLMAILFVGYTFQRLYFLDLTSSHVSPGVATFAGALVVLALLCDCLPWVRDNSQKLLGDKVREIFTLIGSFAAMAALAGCIVKFPEFHKWLSHQHSALDAQSKYILTSILVLFIGWLVVAVGIYRSFLIPILVLPTFVIYSYWTAFSPTVLSIFFLATIASSLINRKILVLTTSRITYL